MKGVLDVQSLAVKLLLVPKIATQPVKNVTDQKVLLFHPWKTFGEPSSVTTVPKDAFPVVLRAAWVLTEEIMSVELLE